MLAAFASALLSHAPRAEECRTACSHCGLVLPAEPIVDGDGRNFCCAGCSTVFAAIQSSGLGAFYEGRDLGIANARPARPTGRRFAELDDDEFARSFERHAD